MGDATELVRRVVEECRADTAADGSAVEGRGAYHCRLRGGKIAEGRDVFFPPG